MENTLKIIAITLTLCALSILIFVIGKLIIKIVKEKLSLKDLSKSASDVRDNK